MDFGKKLYCGNFIVTKKSRSSSKQELKELRDKYGISIMGEGGEYESMTLDSPMHSRPLEVVSKEIEWTRGSGTLRVTSARLL